MKSIAGSRKMTSNFGFIQFYISSYEQNYTKVDLYGNFYPFTLQSSTVGAGGVAALVLLSSDLAFQLLVCFDASVLKSTSYAACLVLGAYYFQFNITKVSVSEFLKEQQLMILFKYKFKSISVFYHLNGKIYQ